jgi:leucyl-tRNA synthetase
MAKYDPKKIEGKWQKHWEESGINKTTEDSKKPKYYILDMFPYPSGSGLHVGHPKGYIATDVISRMKMMQGYNVLHPMGWDAFGLPAENYAIANKIHPKKAVDENIATFKKQLSKIGFTYDWDREVNTTDPKFYKWTQWIFLQLFKKGLAYESYEPINWCPSCQTGLANEDLEDGKCERCGSEVEKKPMRQWVLNIRAYADRMLNDLQKLEKWPESIREMQKNWIGRSEGALIDFKIDGVDNTIKVFTTRPDTLFGATYCVIAPEHKLIEKIKNKITNFNEIEKYQKAAKKKSDLERTELQKDKTGVEILGLKAVNPVNGKKIPIWVADYVLATYGTGAIMAVPAHDERDGEFAKKFNIPVVEVIEPETGEKKPNEEFRSSIVAIVEDPKTGKFLTLNWGPKYGGTLFVGGGRENNESAELTARREIAEETGYKNIELVSETGKLHHHYFAFSKNVARNTEVIGLHFKLSGEEKVSTDHQADEQGKFSLEWLTSEEVLRKMEDENHLLVHQLLIQKKVYTGSGILTNSGEFNGVDSEEAKKKITEFAKGELTTNYKLQNWVFSRQRYWGEPIPIIHCEKCGAVPVPEKDLPVELPNVKHYEPSGTGESPLANIEDWVNTKCPKCNGSGKRETNTMPQWAGSSWYYLRYIDPRNDIELVDKKKEQYWSPVDFYVGGAEHATRHLIYARFWHKFLFDIGVVNYEEPFTRLQNVGLILAEDGRKMSKRWGNVINPDDVINEYGADSLRLYEMFMGPFSQACAWSTNGLVGANRFIEKVWALQEKIEKGFVDEKKVVSTLHQTIKKVGDDIEEMRFNTAIAKMMELANEMTKVEKLSKENYSLFIKILAPFAPHVAEEIWEKLGNAESIFTVLWPIQDPLLAKSDTMTVAIQVNGKVRDELTVDADITEAEIKELALKSEKVQKWLEGKVPKKVIYVKGKLVSVVV